MSTVPTSETLIRINYGSGLTPTEELLKQLGESSFLRFWSHANPHVTPKDELCDLLVICGDYAITFSDKNIEYKPDKGVRVSWGRWYRKAVKESVKQLNGATRKLLGERVPIFKDKQCTAPLGIPIPESDDCHYRVAVVSRVKDLNDPASEVPFIRIDSSLLGDAHTLEGAVPFTLGDVTPDRKFVHVLDVAGLRAVLTELDTVVDFAKYLDARESFIRGKPGNTADSEWSVLARYIVSHSDEGEPQPLDLESVGSSHLTHKEWDNAQFKLDMSNRRHLNEESRVWDVLIEDQARMIEEQSFEFATFNTVDEAERVVRYMALEPRLRRRQLGRMWIEACNIFRPEAPVNLRTVPHSGGYRTTYVFLNVSNPGSIENVDYRNMRRAALQDLMLASLVQVPDSQIIIGIGAEAGGPPESYDLAIFEVDEMDELQLQEKVAQAWRKKQQVFGPPIERSVDDWDIPKP